MVRGQTSPRDGFFKDCNLVQHWRVYDFYQMSQRAQQETDEAFCIWTALNEHNMTCFFFSFYAKGSFLYPRHKRVVQEAGGGGGESFIWKASIWFRLEERGDVLKCEVHVAVSWQSGTF